MVLIPKIIHGCECSPYPVLLVEILNTSYCGIEERTSEMMKVLIVVSHITC